MQIKVIEPKQRIKAKIRVCAYCRVSTEADEQENSLTNQKEYYENLIRSNPSYEYVDVYYDFGISGFKESRPGFQKMMEDARAGKIDLILTKSISRMARNTVTMLKAVRELQSMGVGIFFELQNMNTLSGEGELMLSIYSAFAQAESDDSSKNAYMTFQRKFKEGVPAVQFDRCFGFRLDREGNPAIDEREAFVVRKIFKLAHEGIAPTRIATHLNEMGIRTKTGNREYIRFRMTLSTTDTSKTPKVVDIRLYDIPKAPYGKIGYARPVVLDENGAWESVLENAYDIIVTGEINGEDTLTFKISYRDAKRRYIDSEKKIQIVDDVYKVRTVTDTKATDGTTVTEVYAEAEFYDLTFSVRKEERTFDAELPEVAMQYALADTEWSVGTVEVKTKRTWTSKEKNALSILRNIADLHGGDLVFDCPNRLVHLLTVNGKDSGALFAYKKNMKSIKRVVDTRSLVTRLYAVGAEGLTFADINGGKPYVEDFTFTKDIRITTLDCSSFTNPYQMLEYTNMRLAEYCKPSISYVLNAMDLSVLIGYEHEAWELGDYVRVEDRELGLSITTRIIRREYNLQEPWNTVLELSTTLKNLGSSATQWDSVADTLEGTSMVTNDDIREMVPFNLLRNSRADDGLAYWVSSGFEADGENGASGTASFKAEGVSGMTKSLSQTVYPANRSSYTLSAQIGSENLKKLSDSSQVGIEVVIEYEDGTTETRFIDLY